VNTNTVLCILCTLYSVYSVHCVHCTLCTLYSVLCTLCTLCSVYSTLYSALCTLYSVYFVLCVLCTLYSVYSVHCVLCTLLTTDLLTTALTFVLAVAVQGPPPPSFYAIKGSSDSPSSLRAVTICILNCCECPLLTMGWHPPWALATLSACSGNCGPLRRSIPSSRCKCLCLLWDSKPFVVVSSACCGTAIPLLWFPLLAVGQRRRGGGCTESHPCTGCKVYSTVK